jgi:hypothetical protein
MESILHRTKCFNKREKTVIKIAKRRARNTRQCLVVLSFKLLHRRWLVLVKLTLWLWKMCDFCTWWPSAELQTALHPNLQWKTEALFSESFRSRQELGLTKGTVSCSISMTEYSSGSKLSAHSSENRRGLQKAIQPTTEYALINHQEELGAPQIL